MILPKISIIELVDLKDYETAPLEHRWNIQQLYFKISQLRAYAKMPFVIRTGEHKNRGYRTWESHCQVYEDIMRKTGKTIKVPTQSQHLIGAAVDIADPDGRLKKWITENMSLVEKLDLYFENFDYSIGWVHCQLFAPESGHRFFVPY